MSVVLSILLSLAVVSAFPKQEAPAPKAGAYSAQVSSGGAQPVNALVIATTTPCVIAGPQTATTSIAHFSLNLNVATGTAGSFVIGTSTSPYATSTHPFATVAVSAGSQTVYTWNGGVNNDQLYPGTYIVAGMGAGSAVGYGYTYGGSCSTVLLTD